MLFTMSKQKKKVIKQEKSSKPIQSKSNNGGKVFIIAGSILVLLGLLLFILIYYPVIFQELTYTLKPGTNSALVLTKSEEQLTSISSTHQKKIIRPVDEEYGLVIPKIGANTKVIADVSPYNEKEYQIALTKGVAHARDTALPGEFGNMFIFAHSAANWYQANRYNAIFYLLTKLEKGDSIYVFKDGKKYLYKATGQKIIEANDISYLSQNKEKKTITLMTCWPPGTTMKRLVVEGELEE